MKPKRQQVLRVAGLAMLIPVLLVIWLLVDDGDSDEPPGGAEIVSVEALRGTAAANKDPIYWAGPPEEAQLELSQQPGRTYVRYLTGEAEAGDRRPFLTVSSYRFENPTAALREQGREPGGVIAAAPDGGTVYFSRQQPQSVYLAYPEVDVQVEVFAPSFQQALQLVTSGRVVPVE